MELRILQTVKIKKQLRVERIKYWVFFYILVEESEVRIQPDHKIYVDIGLLVVLHYEIIDDVRFLFLCTLFHFVTERECKHLDLFWALAFLLVACEWKLDFRLGSQLGQHVHRVLVGGLYIIVVDAYDEESYE